MSDSNRRKLLGVERVPHLGIRHPGRRRLRAALVSDLNEQSRAQRARQLEHSRKPV